MDRFMDSQNQRERERERQRERERERERIRCIIFQARKEYLRNLIWKLIFEILSVIAKSFPFLHSRRREMAEGNSLHVAFLTPRERGVAARRLNSPCAISQRTAKRIHAYAAACRQVLKRGKWRCSE